MSHHDVQDELTGHRRRPSTSTSFQFPFSPSLSPPAVGEASATRPRGFSEVSQLTLGDELPTELGSSASTSSYRLQTPGTPEWTWTGGSGGETSDSAGKNRGRVNDAQITSSPLASPSVEYSATRGSAVDLGSSNRAAAQHATNELADYQVDGARFRPRAATDLREARRPALQNRDRSMSLSNILRQKLQRSDTDEKPRWRSALKRNDSSSRLSSRDVSGSSSTTSLGLASPELSAKRPTLFGRTSSALKIGRRSKSNISLTLPRSSSAVDTAALVTRSTAPVKEPRDYFNLLLPKELQLLIIRTLLDGWKRTPGAGRWSGEVGGRRELIKLSRVSKAWEQLVFDGQLWTDLHLTPFVHYIAPGTLQRLLSHSAPFVRTLDMHGLRNLQGGHFSSALAPLGPFRFRSIDLRGCRKLGTDAVNRLLEQCPELRELNLKGLHAVEPSTLDVIATCHPLLESLILSRCANISFGDLVTMLTTLKTKESLIAELRLANLKGYGPTASMLLPAIAKALPRLITLDLQGSPHVFDGSFRDLAAVYTDAGTPCQIKHLNISSCSELTGDALLHMLPHLHQLEILEMASYGDRLKDDALLSLIKAAPHLRKIDLDYATVITDAVLVAIAAPKEIPEEEIPSKLQAIVLSYAKAITPEGMLRLIRGCPELLELDLDNTDANAEVMNAFYEAHDRRSSLSLIDCRGVTAAEQAETTKRLGTRARAGTAGYEYRPFAYTSTECKPTKPVLKTFQAWKDIHPPKNWRDMLPDKPLANTASVNAGAALATTQPRRPDFEEKLSCAIM